MEKEDVTIKMIDKLKGNRHNDKEVIDNIQNKFQSKKSTRRKSHSQFVLSSRNYKIVIKQSKESQ